MRRSGAELAARPAGLLAVRVRRLVEERKRRSRRRDALEIGVEGRRLADEVRLVCEEVEVRCPNFSRILPKYPCFVPQPPWKYK